LFYALILQALFLFAPNARAQQQAPSADEVSTQLAQARAEASAHHYERAIELYRSVLGADPDNRQALSELADALETAGRWHEALPFLQHLLALQPDNAPKVFQLGRMESWSGDTRADGLALLRRATELDAQRPEYLAGYAEVLSWDGSKRSEAAALFDRALLLDARNEAVLIPGREPRARARERFLIRRWRRTRAMRGLWPGADCLIPGRGEPAKLWPITTPRWRLILPTPRRCEAKRKFSTGEGSISRHATCWTAAAARRRALPARIRERSSSWHAPMPGLAAIAMRWRYSIRCPPLDSPRLRRFAATSTASKPPSWNLDLACVTALVE